MDLLVLGGTAYLGRYVVQAALDRGHQVTCLARATTAKPPLGARLVRADRSVDGALAGVAGTRWDAVVDVARHPGFVRRSVAELAGRAAHYVFVSTGNVYADHSTGGQDESAPTLAPLAEDVMPDMESYGAAKVACEQYVLAGFGSDRALIARSGLIGGPGDWSGRTGYWPWRFANPSSADGTVLVPDAPDLPTQVIDVRDLAAWLVMGAEEQVSGVFNTVGDTVPLGEHLAAARRVARHTGPMVVAPPAWLVERGVAEFMGPRSLPLWLHDPDWLGFTDFDGSAARAAGLRPRALDETLEAALAFETARPPDEVRPAGLTDAEERDLLSLLS
jgi:nucleoside-diphosphate-sugar epimerase